MRNVIRVLMLLCLIGPTFALNDFSGDADFMCEWKFDDGALTVDSLGTNTLAVNIGAPSADTVNFKEGDASLDGDVDNRMIITDADYDADFPLKNAGSAVFTVLFWAQSGSSFDAGVKECMFSKEWFQKYSWTIGHQEGVGNGLYMGVSDGFPNWEYVSHGNEWTVSQWYFVGASFDSGDKSWRMRVWDDTAGSILGGSTTTGTSTRNLVPSDALTLTHTALGDADWDGAVGARLDDIIWCKRVLNDSEIDQIRAGTFGGAGAMMIISKQLEWEWKMFFNKLWNGELNFDQFKET